MDPSFAWLYLLIFLMIPLARILPRFVSRRRDSENVPRREAPDAGFNRIPTSGAPPSPPQNAPEPAIRPATRRELVIDSMRRGLKRFEDIQNRTGLSTEDLDRILGELERERVILVHTKQGVLGPRVELYLTDTGFRNA